MLTTITSVAIDLSGSTIMEKGLSALREIESNAEFLGKDKANVLWLRIKATAGIEIHRFGGSYTATPGVFGGDFLYVSGIGGSEIFELGDEIALEKISRVIRRAIKLSC